MPRVSNFVKLFFYFSFISFLLFVMAIIHNTSRNFLRNVEYGNNILDSTINHSLKFYRPSEMKYILLWTGQSSSPLSYMGSGQKGFIESKCPVNNCFVSDDRTLFSGDYFAFDAIVFYGPVISMMAMHRLPRVRSSRQKYIFATIESAHNYPVCAEHFDGFFNWTWTYKLDSDARWGYVVVRDVNGVIIGPKAEMHWIADMNPIGDDLKEKLKSKKKAAAWFVSNCASKSERERFVEDVQKHLKTFGLTVDIYGECGPLKCPRNKMDDCLKKLEEDYYFYFSFENSFSEDYVTEKLIHALQHDTVPVVFGGANYTRFMPDSIYLNARELGPAELARTMHEIIKNPDRYHDFFRYKNHYSFWRRMQSVETNDYCNLCALLNNNTLVNTTTVYNDFRGWWNTKSNKVC